MAIVMAAQFLRIRHDAGKVFAGVMAAWALNCATLFIMLYLKVEGVEWAAVAAAPIWTVNALILAISPLVLYFVFLHLNGRIQDNDS